MIKVQMEMILNHLSEQLSKKIGKKFTVEYIRKSTLNDLRKKFSVYKQKSSCIFLSVFIMIKMENFIKIVI